MPASGTAADSGLVRDALARAATAITTRTEEALVSRFPSLTITPGPSDTHAALQGLIDDGAPVTLGPGEHVLSEPLVLRTGSTLSGSFAPAYQPVPDPPLPGTRIVPAPGFTGAALIQVPGTARGVGLSRLGVVGRGIGSAVDGIRFSDTPGQGEMSVSIRDVGVYGCTGSGVSGSLHVASIDGLHIARCGRHGIEVASGHRWNDIKMSRVFAYFNARSALLLAGAGTGAVSVTQSRFERSGQTYGDPQNSGASFNPDEAGVRIQHGKFLTFSDCSTDANTGPGIHVDGQAGTAAAGLGDIKVIGGSFMRDGGGDQSAGYLGAALRVSGASSSEADVPRDVQFVSVDVSFGRSDDVNAGGELSPAVGLHVKDAWQVYYTGRPPKVRDGGQPFLFEGSQWGTLVEYVDLSGGKYRIIPHASPTPVQV